VIAVAIVSRYLEDNVHTDYDDGTFESFDTTQLSIVEPAEATGRVVDIDHNTPPPLRVLGEKLVPYYGGITRILFEKKRGQTQHYFSSGIRILAFKIE